MKIIIAINGHGLRWHVCNAIAKGIVAELSAKDGKYYSLEGARVMVEGVPPHPAHTLSPLKVLGTGTLVLSGLVDPCCELVL